MSDGSVQSPLRERSDVNRYWFWVLFRANRWAVAAGFAVVVFLSFVLLGELTLGSLRSTMRSSDAVETLFGGLVGGIITGATLVVTINQLVLSQEIGSLGSQRDRMEAALSFRGDAADVLGRPPPADPATYLGALVRVTEHRAEALPAALDGEDRELREAVDGYVEDVLADGRHARGRLEDAEFGTFEVVSAALDYNYDRKLYDLQRLRAGRELSEEGRAGFEDLHEAITTYGIVQEYVKDLYLQWELVKLSRAILYAAVVSITLTGGTVVFVDATTAPGTLLGIEGVLWVVAAAFAVATLPFLLFTAFVLRLATIAKQTLPTGPLVLD